jgi:hypothetical protein
MRRKRTARAVPLILSAAIVAGLGLGGTALAATHHDSIILRGADNSPINPRATSNNAYSIKQTCMGDTSGTNGCHSPNNTAFPQLKSYDEIERHSFHAQNGSNELRGFNGWNPDAMAPKAIPNSNPLAYYASQKDPDPFRTGASPIGKNWVQSPGHVGNW